MLQFGLLHGAQKGKVHKPKQAPQMPRPCCTRESYSLCSQLYESYSLLSTRPAVVDHHAYSNYRWQNVIPRNFISTAFTARVHNPRAVCLFCRWRVKAAAWRGESSGQLEALHKQTQIPERAPRRTVTEHLLGSMLVLDGSGATLPRILLPQRGLSRVCLLKALQVKDLQHTVTEHLAALPLTPNKLSSVST